MSKKNIGSALDYLVTEDMDFIVIPVSFQKRSYELIAVKTDEHEYYRASTNALEEIYRQIQKEFPGIASIRVVSELTTFSANYNVVACQLHLTPIGNQPEKYFDVQIGETKVAMKSSDYERDTPATNAYNKARAKCIYEDLLGLPSRFFNADGGPVLYFDDTPKEKKEEEKEEPLNSMETKELDELGKILVRFRDSNTGVVGDGPLASVPKKIVDWYSGEMNDDEDLRKKVQRFAALRDKKEKGVTKNEEVA